MKRTAVMTMIAALACAAQGIETKCLDGLWEFAFAEGVAVWQFCDSRSYFRSGADIRTRPLGRNMAGLYDIHRREKLAAKAVRKLFKDERPREP